MKVAVVLFAILGLSLGASIKIENPTEILVRDPIHVKDLSADLDEFLALIPSDQIVEILLKYLEDPEFQLVLFFLFSEQFHDLYNTLHSVPEFIDFWNYLDEQGIDVNRYDHIVREFLGIPWPHNRVGKNDLGGVNGFLWEIIGILPLDEIRALALEKLDTSPEFFALYQNLRSEEFQNIIRALRAEPTYQFIIEYLEIFGINVDAIAIIIVTIFGWDL